MTIRSSVNIRFLNAAYGNFQSGVEAAPDRMFERSKQVARLIDECSHAFYKGLRDMGIQPKGEDQFREIEALMYGVVSGAEPECLSTEGLGRHVEGPRGAEVVANLVRDRDFIENQRAV